MPITKVRDNEMIDNAIRRFKRACEKAGISTEVRRREHHEKDTTRRQRMAKAARKRHIKKLEREAPIPNRLKRRKEKSKR